MFRNSNSKRIKDTAGTWDYDRIVGAKVKVKSIPIVDFNFDVNTSDVYTVKDVIFKISIDGKVITLVRLVEAPGNVFPWKDLMVVEINDHKCSSPIVGELKPGKVTV